MSNLEIIYEDPKELKPNNYNPNEMDDKQFNSLCHQIQSKGFRDTIHAATINKEKIILNGEHKWKAAIALGIQKVPVIYHENLTEDELKSMTVSLNMHGTINPLKLAQMIADWKKKKIKEDQIRNLMGYTEGDIKFKKAVQMAREKMNIDQKEKLDLLY